LALKFEYDFDDNRDEHISSEEFLLDERKERKKVRKSEREKKHYKFSDKDISGRGVVSTTLAVIALIALIGSLVLSVMAGGEGGQAVGILAGISFACSLLGIIIGLLAFRQTEVFLGIAWIGLIFSGCVWVLVDILIIMGM
jgi:hypothetical protein